MKRFFSIGIAMLYLVLATGFVIDVHYCCDRVSKVALYTGSQVQNTCNCKMAKKRSCCREEFRTVKLTTDHSPSAAIHSSAAHSFVFTAPVFLYKSNNNAVAQTVSAFIGHDPPPVEKPYLLNASLRI